jgi:hypothetical protein
MNTNSDLIYYIKKYKNLILEETYPIIIDEMIYDLKETLLNISKDVDVNYLILETFYNINNSEDIINNLDNLQDILTEAPTLSIGNIKASFIDKHTKIIDRDKKWLNKNKKKILGLDYTDIQLEVLSDYKVTFEQLLNRHNIFDKIFVNSENNEGIGDKLRRFEDKHENLKNGLDNYFRTGTSRREIGLRKVSGDEAKTAVENMVAYCESFLSGKQFLEEKMNTIIVAINDASVKESLTPIETLKVLLEKDTSAVKALDDSIEDIDKTEDKLNDKKPVKEKEPKKKDEEPTDEDIPEEEPVEDEEVETEEPKSERGIEDRQVGVAVLLTVAEERYFDYINILKGLIEE